MSREIIKRVALELFRRYSYVKTSVADIAAAAGIGKGSIYLAFKTKEEILFALIDEEILAQKAKTSQVLGDPGVALETKVDLFSRSLIEIHFWIRDLMFGSFENVDGRELKDVYLKFAHYIDEVAAYLAQTLALHGYEYTPRRVTAVREFILFLSGRIVVYILSHDWNNRDEITVLMPVWARQIFQTLVQSDSGPNSGPNSGPTGAS